MAVKEEDKKGLLDELYKRWEKEGSTNYIKLTRVPNCIPPGFINKEVYDQNLVTDELLKNLSDDKLIKSRKVGNDIEIRLTKDGVNFVLFIRSTYATKSTNSVLLSITFVMALIAVFTLVLSILSYYLYVNQLGISVAQLGISAAQLGHSLNNTGLINASSQLLSSSSNTSSLNIVVYSVWAIIVIIIIFLGLIAYRLYNMNK